ncbi:MAG: indole-3-glycerol phosphate synthase TrpC [Candidatus Omnitrophica bacterium]|nr:indole-3-glycerol phosphate synthase TrpC [Candidatus Omnitrophota bacterium]
MKKDILYEIVAKKRERLTQAKLAIKENELLARARNSGPRRPFIKAINKPHKLSLIAEIKKASPSAGLIRKDFDAKEIALIYEEAGVSCISVLTEEDYFQGDINYLSQIRDTVDLPLLRKDFIFDPYQIYESRAFGADAILLIADLLPQALLGEFLGLAKDLNLDCLVEVSSEKDLKKALKAGADLIGINNRNLHTLEMDPRTVERLFPLVPSGKIVVIESGIKSHQDILFLKVLGVKAVLIGETFMAAEDIKSKIQEIFRV